MKIYVSEDGMYYCAYDEDSGRFWAIEKKLVDQELIEQKKQKNKKNKDLKEEKISNIDEKTFRSLLEGSIYLRSKALNPDLRMADDCNFYYYDSEKRKYCLMKHNYDDPVSKFEEEIDGHIKWEICKYDSDYNVKWKVNYFKGMSGKVSVMFVDKHWQKHYVDMDNKKLCNLVKTKVRKLKGKWAENKESFQALAKKKRIAQKSNPIIKHIHEYIDSTEDKKQQLQYGIDKELDRINAVELKQHLKRCKQEFEQSKDRKKLDQEYLMVAKLLDSKEKEGSQWLAELIEVTDDIQYKKWSEIKQLGQDLAFGTKLESREKARKQFREILEAQYNQQLDEIKNDKTIKTDRDKQEKLDKAHRQLRNRQTTLLTYDSQLKDFYITEDELNQKYIEYAERLDRESADKEIKKNQTSINRELKKINKEYELNVNQAFSMVSHQIGDLKLPFLKQAVDTIRGRNDIGLEDKKAFCLEFAKMYDWLNFWSMRANNEKSMNDRPDLTEEMNDEITKRKNALSNACQKFINRLQKARGSGINQEISEFYKFLKDANLQLFSRNDEWYHHYNSLFHHTNILQVVSDIKQLEKSVQQYFDSKGKIKINKTNYANDLKQAFKQKDQNEILFAHIMTPVYKQKIENTSLREINGEWHFQTKEEKEMSKKYEKIIEDNKIAWRDMKQKQLTACRQKLEDVQNKNNFWSRQQHYIDSYRQNEREEKRQADALFNHQSLLEKKLINYIKSTIIKNTKKEMEDKDEIALNQSVILGIDNYINLAEGNIHVVEDFVNAVITGKEQLEYNKLLIMWEGQSSLEKMIDKFSKKHKLQSNSQSENILQSQNILQSLFGVKELEEINGYKKDDDKSSVHSNNTTNANSSFSDDNKNEKLPLSSSQRDLLNGGSQAEKDYRILLKLDPEYHPKLQNVTDFQQFCKITQEHEEQMNLAYEYNEKNKYNKKDMFDDFCKEKGNFARETSYYFNHKLTKEQKQYFTQICTESYKRPTKDILSGEPTIQLTLMSKNYTIG